MYCHPCQRAFSEDAIYCSQCGQKLTDEVIDSEMKIEQTIAIYPNDEQDIRRILEKNKQQVRQKPLFKFVFRSVIVMTILFMSISTVLIMTYSKETKINEKVLLLQTEAKKSALAGEYDEALIKLDEALLLRPHFNALKADQDIVHEAVRIQRLADELNLALDKGVEVESEKKLDQFRQELNGLKEPIFNPHRELLETMNMKFTILSLTNELTQIITVVELGNLLNVVNGLVGEDANTLREQIKDRIRTTTTAEVNELIKLRRYSGAITAINESLTWLRNDKQLVELKQKIEKQQNEYEQAEQRRIQQAMEQQAAEDLINQTAAVELTGFTKRMDELGNGVIIVSLKNVATRAIYDVELEYSVLNEAGDVLYMNKTNVEPNYINSGDSTIFNFRLPTGLDISMVNKVVINKGTWSLD